MIRLVLLSLLALALRAQSVPLNSPSIGLYESGNSIPQDHAQIGLARAALIQPLDVAGLPSASGKIVLLCVGISNTSGECAGNSTQAGTPESFIWQASHDASVNPAMRVVNGAIGGVGVAPAWYASPLPWNGAGYATQNYNRVAAILASQVPSLSAKQVQAVWLKVADPNPTSALPSPSADAYQLTMHLGEVLRRLRVEYPHLQQVFISSRSYAGYATTNLNPEPYAYESGLAVKWAINAQIQQMSTASQATVFGTGKWAGWEFTVLRQRGAIDPRAGDLDYNNGIAPWAAWGPYLWSAGTTPNPEGLAWYASDYQTDGTHQNAAGIAKVAARLLAYFKDSQHTAWFRSGPPPPPPPVVLSTKQQILVQADLGLQAADIATARTALQVIQALAGSLP